MLKTRKDFPTTLKYKFYVLSQTFPEQFKTDEKKVYTKPVNGQALLLFNGQQLSQIEDSMSKKKEIQKIGVSEIRSKKNDNEHQKDTSMLNLLEGFIDNPTQQWQEQRKQTIIEEKSNQAESCSSPSLSNQKNGFGSKIYNKNVNDSFHSQHRQKSTNLQNKYPPIGIHKTKSDKLQNLNSSNKRIQFKKQNLQNDSQQQNQLIKKRNQKVNRYQKAKKQQQLKTVVKKQSIQVSQENKRNIIDIKLRSNQNTQNNNQKTNQSMYQTSKTSKIIQKIITKSLSQKIFQKQGIQEKQNPFSERLKFENQVSIFSMKSPNKSLSQQSKQKISINFKDGQKNQNSFEGINYENQENDELNQQIQIQDEQNKNLFVQSIQNKLIDQQKVQQNQISLSQSLLKSQLNNSNRIKSQIQNVEQKYDKNLSISLTNQKDELVNRFLKSFASENNREWMQIQQISNDKTKIKQQQKIIQQLQTKNKQYENKFQQQSNKLKIKQQQIGAELKNVIKQQQNTITTLRNDYEQLQKMNKQLKNKIIKYQQQNEKKHIKIQDMFIQIMNKIQNSDKIVGQSYKQTNKKLQYLQNAFQNNMIKLKSQVKQLEENIFPPEKLN